MFTRYALLVYLINNRFETDNIPKITKFCLS